MWCFFPVKEASYSHGSIKVFNQSSKSLGKLGSIFPDRSIDHYRIVKLTEIPVSFSDARKVFIKVSYHNRILLPWTGEATSRNYLRRNGGNAFCMFSFCFIAEMFSALSAVFIFSRALVCFVLVWLFIIWPFNRF